MQVTKKNDKKVSGLTQVIGAVSGVAFMLAASSSMAHETRFIDIDGAAELKVVVGNNPEPVYEDRDYHTDLFLTHFTAGGEEVPVDTGEASSSASLDDLTIHALMLKEDVHVVSVDDPLVVKKAKLDQVKKRRGEVNRYGTPIRYSDDGAIGFHLTGSITTNDGTVVALDEIFVCGDGAVAAHGFSCVKDHPQVFPGDRREGKDKASYKDGDRYSLDK